MRDVLDMRTQRVNLDGSSSRADVISGVPQVGLLLSFTFIHELPGYTTSDVRLSADDVLMYRHIRSEEDAAALHKDLS